MFCLILLNLTNINSSTIKGKESLLSMSIVGLTFPVNNDNHTINILSNVTDSDFVVHLNDQLNNFHSIYN